MAPEQGLVACGLACNWLLSYIGRIHGSSWDRLQLLMLYQSKGSTHRELHAAKMSSSASSDQEMLASYVSTIGILFRLRFDEVAREDFLAGKILKHQNLEAMLTLLDGLIELLMPAWNLEWDKHKSKAEEAAVHYSKLYGKSNDVLEIPCEHEVPFKYRYDTWMNALNQLQRCSYWKKVSNKERCSQDAREEQCFADVTSAEESEEAAGSERDKRSARRTHGAHSKPMKGKSSSRDDLGDLFASKDRSDRRVHEKSPNSKGTRHKSKKVAGFGHVSSDNSDSSSESDSESSCERRTRRRYRHVTKDVVPPELFDVDGRTSMKEFLKEFNKYFEIKFEDKHDKTGKLRCRKLAEFLDGEALRAYEAIGGKYVPFDDMQEELLAWYKSQKVESSYEKKAKFNQASMNPDESLKLYCIRLSRLALQAFPRRKSDRVRELIDKLMTTVPRSFVKSIEKREETKRTFDSKAFITWDDITQLADDTDRKKKQQQMKTSSAVSPARHAVANIAVGTNTHSNQVSPPSRQSAGMQGNNFSAVHCHYCGIFGHKEITCKKKFFKTAQCFNCGEVGHGVRACPNGKPRQPPPRKHSPVCGYCGGPHLGMDCDVSLVNPASGSGSQSQQNGSPGAIAKNYGQSRGKPQPGAVGGTALDGGASQKNSGQGNFNRGGRNGAAGGGRQSANHEPIGPGKLSSASGFSGN